ncbi:MAG: hypothetical protein LBD82_05220 [Deltaproteobacteria bacterium]|jgi:hypothetical protein|nr:hypothetical protein [Deltaproteobacteria bacterium]
MPGDRSTIQAQAWDQLAREELGAVAARRQGRLTDSDSIDAEAAMSALLAANPQARGVLLFYGEARVTVPPVSGKISVSAPPPWKKETD